MTCLFQQKNNVFSVPDPGSLSVEIANLKDYIGIGDKSFKQYLGIEDKSLKEIFGIQDKPLLGTEDQTATITIENPSPKESVDIPPVIQAENINEISENKELLELSAAAASDSHGITGTESGTEASIGLADTGEQSDRGMACEEAEKPSENAPPNDYFGRSLSFQVMS